MAIVINGSGTVTGLAVGGLPDGTVDAGTLATDSVTAAKLEASAITNADLPAGTVLQVIHRLDPTVLETSSTTFADTTCYASITPSSSSSKVLVQVAMQMATTNNDSNWHGLDVRLLRGSTAVYTPPDMAMGAHATHAHIGGAMFHLDSPSTTSAITYKIQVKCETSGVGTRWNGNSGSQVQMVLTEVAG